tara:strand:+ start:285 stop:953 length:669 start_codon:yes stop_codon:yes gene_type:complete
LIELKDLSHTYRQGDENIDVLNNISIKFESNQVVGLIGPSGSGKSTLLNILGLVQKPLMGNLKVCNILTNPLSEFEKTKIRKEMIGYISQESQLLEDFTCIENIAIPLLLNGLSKNHSFNSAKKIMEEFGLKKRTNFKPSLLSGGERQRISVLRALVKKPKILLADEPTGSLDDKNARLVMDYIFNLSKKFKTLCIIATHNLSFISNFDFCYEISNSKLNKL